MLYNHLIHWNIGLCSFRLKHALVLGDIISCKFSFVRLFSHKSFVCKKFIGIQIRGGQLMKSTKNHPHKKILLCSGHHNDKHEMKKSFERLRFFHL